MKSKIPACILLAGFLLTFMQSYAQLLDHKVNLYVEARTGKFFGNASLKEGNFSYPSFFANMKDVSGVSVKGLYKIKPWMSLGLGVDFCHATHWVYNGHSEYNGSSVAWQTLSPSVQFHTKFTQNTLFERLTIFTEINPMVGVARTKTSGTAFIFESSGNSLSDPTNSSDPCYGVAGKIGMEYSVNQFTAVTVSYSIQKNTLSSNMYADTQFSTSWLNFGIILKLWKDKRFIYNL